MKQLAAPQRRRLAGLALVLGALPALLALGSGSVGAQTPPQAQARPAIGVLPAARWHYEVEARTHGLTLQGEAQLSWQPEGRRYQAELTVRSPLLPARVQRSVGRITPAGLAPEEFTDRSRKEQVARFDHASGQAIFSGDHPAATLPPGLQDRLSVLLQLAVRVASAPARHPAGTELTLPTASTREIEDWTFRVEGRESLQLPGGRVEALKLQRLPRHPSDQKVELWLAPRQAYAPVRVRLTNPNGDSVDQRWRSTDKP